MQRINDWLSDAAVLIAVFGVLAMTPSWWRHRRAARRREPPAAAGTAPPPAAPPAPDVTMVRDGL